MFMRNKPCFFFNCWRIPIPTRSGSGGFCGIHQSIHALVANQARTALSSLREVLELSATCGIVQLTTVRLNYRAQVCLCGCSNTMSVLKAVVILVAARNGLTEEPVRVEFCLPSLNRALIRPFRTTLEHHSARCPTTSQTSLASIGVTYIGFVGRLIRPSS